MRKSSIGLALPVLLTLILSLASVSAYSACVPESDSNALITHCKLKLAEYPRPVHVYFPENHSQKYLVHFHGHNLDGYSHFNKRWGDYGQYLQGSSSDAVLIVPESEGKCTTYDTFFADALRTKKFFLALERELNVTTLTSLSGHSGAYRVLNRLAGYALKNLISFSAIGLFDASYSETPDIKNYVKANDILFYSAFVTGPRATTEEISRLLMKELSGENIYFVPVEGESNESLLEQHFLVLKRGSLEEFFSKASAL